MKEVNVPQTVFFHLFTGDRFEWRNEAKDLEWWEAHAHFVWDKQEQKTVGLLRTSSYGAPDEYIILEHSSSAT